MLVGAKAFAASINRHLIAVAERLLMLVVAVHVRLHPRAHKQWSCLSLQNQFSAPQTVALDLG